MKNLLLTFAILLSINVIANASNIGDGKIKVIESKEFVFSVSEDISSSMILSSDYNEENNQIEFLFNDEVVQIEVIDNNGEVYMILPIMSKDVSLGLSLFDQGNYIIGIQLEGEEVIQYTDLLIK